MKNKRKYHALFNRKLKSEKVQMENEGKNSHKKD